MKRLLIALAGYALYRWWSSQANTPPGEPSPPPAPPRRTPPRRKPVEPA